MDEVTRREVLAAALAAAADDRPALTDAEKADRERVIACGFTEAEADCWVALSRAAAAFLNLPKLHPMDDHEIAHAVHVLQYRLMSRPAFRKYRKPPDKK